MAAKISIAPKNKVVKRKEVTGEIPDLVFEPLMAEIEAWNERKEDEADPAYFLPDAFRLLTEWLIEERRECEKEAKPKNEKGERGSRRTDKSTKPDMHVAAQSA
jgi:hypothetical protein